MDERFQSVGEKKTVVPSIIPDPLERVVEGENRYERYRRFIINVLGKIWPPTSDSGNYGNDFWRSNRYDERFSPDANQNEWIDDYTQFSPKGIDPLNLTAEEFETVVQNLGTADYVRIRSIPPQLLQPGVSAVLAGGSCALETNVMHTLADIKTYIKSLNKSLSTPDYNDPEKNKNEIDKIDKNKKRLVNFVRSALAIAPTITHISGALLGGHDVGVHYWETDMWRERLEKEYGLPQDEAEQAVFAAYQRIHEAVQRRSLLINPNSIILEVNFDELELPAAIKSWAASMNLYLDDLDNINNYRVIEVIYTYVGPEQLDLLKKALQKKQEQGTLTKEELAAANTVMEGNLHVRVKQIDHLNWGSMDLPEEVIMGLRPLNEQEQVKYQEDYPYRMGITVMSDVYQRHTYDNPTSCVVGFSDLPTFGNGVQHESRNVGFIFKGESPDDPNFFESLDQQLHHPARLNQLNINEHLAYLKKYTVDVSEQRRELLTEMNMLRGIIKPSESELTEATRRLDRIIKQIERHQTNIDIQNQIINFLKSLIENSYVDSPANRQLAKQIKEMQERALQQLQQKKAQGSFLSEDDQEDPEKLSELIKVMIQIEEGEKPVFSETVSEQLEKISDRTKQLINDLKYQINAKTSEREAAEADVNSKQADFDNLANEREQLTYIYQALSDIDITYFPLRDNPFIHHAMQFLWDPDFAIFLREAVAIQEAKTEKKINKDQANEQMRLLSERIYPKLEAYIKYIYGIIEYPTEMRTTRIFSE